MNCEQCICTGGWLGTDGGNVVDAEASCSECSLTCGGYGTANSNCTGCACEDWITGDLCDQSYMRITIFFSGVSMSNFSNDVDTELFGTMIAEELAFIFGWSNSSAISPLPDTLAVDSSDGLFIELNIDAPDTDVDFLDNLRTTLNDAVDSENSFIYRSFALQYINSDVDIIYEGNLPNDDDSTSIFDFILDWIKNHLNIVIPLLSLFLVLIMYKCYIDKREKRAQLKLVNLDAQGEEEPIAPRRKKIREMSKRYLGDNDDKEEAGGREKPKGKSKGKRSQKSKQKHRKRYESAVDEFDILVSDFGVQKRTGNDFHDGVVHSLQQEFKDVPLPANWTIQYFENGTVFYFNSATNDVRVDRP